MSLNMSFLVHIRLISANYSQYHPIRGSKSRQKVVENRWINIGFTYSLNSANLSPLSEVTLLWGTYIVRIWPWQHWYSRRKVQLFFSSKCFHISSPRRSHIKHPRLHLSFFFVTYVMTKPRRLSAAVWRNMTWSESKLYIPSNTKTDW